MGVTAISIGVGAIFPAMNLISKPFVCPSGKMETNSQYYQVSPVESVTTLTWYCVDSTTGDKTELGLFPMSLYSGLIYGLLLFAVIFVFLLYGANKTNSDSQKTGTTGRGDPELEQLNQFEKEAQQFRASTAGFRQPSAAAGSKPSASGSALAKMTELKQLLDSKMISKAEYEQKRAEILKDL